MPYVQEIFQEIFQPTTSKKGLNGYLYDFFVDNRDFDINDITNIYIYLMKKHDKK